MYQPPHRIQWLVQCADAVKGDLRILTGLDPMPADVDRQAVLGTAWANLRVLEMPHNAYEPLATFAKDARVHLLSLTARR